MNAYINRLIAVMVVSQVASGIAPDQDHARRSVRVVCALTALLTLLSPFRQLLAASGDIAEKITAFFTVDSAAAYEETEAGAVGLMQYAAERYGISDFSVVIRTDETDTEVIAVEFHIPDCPYSKRAAIREELTGQLGLPVEVFADSCGKTEDVP